ncbi:hypothetical protein [Catenulispora rubra]|uniref:hypothetical protein n=1 Tax=Catenulispora rubra TaxID=280293 RepID=UPI0018921C61|nr:hypothetical protein [Catenulispora rubra]
MGESIGVGDVPQAIADGAKLVLRAEQFKADLAAKVTEISAKELQPDLFPKPGDEFSQNFAPDYTKNAHTLKDALVNPSGGTASDAGEAMVGVGNFLTDTFAAVWTTDQQNSQNLGSV